MKLVRAVALFGPTVFAVAAHAYPAAVFQTAGPVRGPEASPGTEVPDGTYSVAARTGAAER